MSTEKHGLARVDELGLMQLGEVFVKSGFFKDCREHAQAVVKVLAGRELGIGPMAAMVGIHVIEGKPSIGAHLVAAGIKRSKRYDYVVREKTPARCSIEFFALLEAGGRESIGTETYTIEDAKAAGLSGKKNWKENPKAMLFARAIGQGYRTFCPDALDMQVYAEGEIDDGPSPPADAIEAEGARVPPSAPRTTTSSPSPGPTSSPSGTRSSPGAAPGASTTPPARAAAPSTSAAGGGAAPPSAAAATSTAPVDEIARARAEARELLKRAPDAWRTKAESDVAAAKDLATLQGITANVRQAIGPAPAPGTPAPGSSTKSRPGAPAFGGGKA